MSEKLSVLVTGATGQQGGAVTTALIARGHNVRALTRSPNGDAAARLASAGVEVVGGDFSDPTSLREAARGMDTVFLMSTSFEAGPEGETAQATAMIDAALAAGVGHLIYSSVGSANRSTGIPHFESKYAVEQYLATAGIPYTIGAPVYFMDNLTSRWLIGPLMEGEIALALPADRKLQQIAVADIGAFAASLAERRERVFGRRYDIAGDELTGARMAAAVSEASGRTIRYREIPLDALRQQMPEMAIMFEWFERVGYSADIEALRHEFSDVGWQSYPDWARTRDWTMLQDRAAAMRA